MISISNALTHTLVRRADSREGPDPNEGSSIKMGSTDRQAATSQASSSQQPAAPQRPLPCRRAEPTTTAVRPLALGLGSDPLLGPLPLAAPKQHPPPHATRSANHRPRTCSRPLLRDEQRGTSTRNENTKSYLKGSARAQK